jgi:hypothetical protein
VPGPALPGVLDCCRKGLFQKIRSKAGIVISTRLPGRLRASARSMDVRIFNGRKGICAKARSLGRCSAARAQPGAAREASQHSGRGYRIVTQRGMHTFQIHANPLNHNVCHIHPRNFCRAVVGTAMQIKRVPKEPSWRPPAAFAKKEAAVNNTITGLRVCCDYRFCMPCLIRTCAVCAYRRICLGLEPPVPGVRSLWRFAATRAPHASCYFGAVRG